MPIIRISAPDDPCLDDFDAVPDPVRLRESGQFVVEGRFAIETLLRERRFHVRALLLTESTHRALAADLAVPDWSGVNVYVASAAHFRIGGYDFHRGYLALADRPEPTPPNELLDAAPRDEPLLVLERVGNPDNVGGLFRNAAAFGAGAVVLSPGCADPFYRKAIRTSAGATLRLPFATASDWPAAFGLLRAGGYLVAALTPPRGVAGETTELGEFAARRPPERPVALVVGSEGDGLTAAVLAAADARVSIDIDSSVDSLNVATAAAIALHRLYRDHGV
ncbi:MAG: RNA methyltransferase [Acidobacteria bacterium]|nr:RNA methyltransferase [Acidobacteriota bacterium]